MANSFNKTKTAIFQCMLCFLRAFPFISLLILGNRKVMSTVSIIIVLSLQSHHNVCVCPPVNSSSCVGKMMSTSIWRTRSLETAAGRQPAEPCRWWPRPRRQAADPRRPSVYPPRRMVCICGHVLSIHSSTNSPPNGVDFLWSCDKVYHKQEVGFLLYLLGQIVTWQYNSNPLDYFWPWNVINDHDWQLRNCLLMQWRIQDLTIKKRKTRENTAIGTWLSCL